MPFHAVVVHGTPFRPVGPLETATDGVMVVGTYPSARFATIAGERDVPVADNLGPFETERWFDGSRVRVQPSAAELEELVLAPLELPGAPCWISDLVKVFLLKFGHRKKYKRLGATVPGGYMRQQFEELSHENYARRLCAWAPAAPTDRRSQLRKPPFRALGRGSASRKA